MIMKNSWPRWWCPHILCKCCIYNQNVRSTASFSKDFLNCSLYKQSTITWKIITVGTTKETFDWTFISEKECWIHSKCSQYFFPNPSLYVKLITLWSINSYHQRLYCHPIVFSIWGHPQLPSNIFFHNCVCFFYRANFLSSL